MLVKILKTTTLRRPKGNSIKYFAQPRCNINDEDALKLIAKKRAVALPTPKTRAPKVDLSAKRETQTSTR